MSRCRLFLLIAAMSSAGSSLSAQETVNPLPPPSVEISGQVAPLANPLPCPCYSPFVEAPLEELPCEHGWMLQLLAGCYPKSVLGSDGVPFRLGTDGRPLPSHVYHFDLIPLALRLGCTPTPTLLDDSWFRGHGEVFLEYTADPVLHRWGDFVTGPSILLRYQFQQVGWRLAPYAQGGAGIVFDDISHYNQRLIGGPVEFLLQLQGGLHYHLNSRWSLDVEGGYQHISNANTYSRNVGLNNLGGSIGVTYHFGCSCP